MKFCGRTRLGESGPSDQSGRLPSAVVARADLARVKKRKRVWMERTIRISKAQRLNDRVCDISLTHACKTPQMVVSLAKLPKG
jgi:hypothetical protein